MLGRVNNILCSILICLANAVPSTQYTALKLQEEVDNHRYRYKTTVTAAVSSARYVFVQNAHLNIQLPQCVFYVYTHAC